MWPVALYEEEEREISSLSKHVHLGKITRAHIEKVAACKPRRESSPEADHDGEDWDRKKNIFWLLPYVWVYTHEF